MGLLAFSLTLALAAEPATNAGAVLVTRRSGLTVPQAAELRTQLERALTAAGVPVALEGKALSTRLAGLGVKEPAACNGRRSCVFELGRQLATRHLVSVSISRVEGDSALALELLRVDGEATLAKDSFVVPKGVKDLTALVGPFAEAAKKALAPPPEPVVTAPPPTPPPAVLVPTEPPRTALVEVTPAPTPRSHTAGLVLGGAGVAAAIAGGVLLAVSFATRAPLTTGSGMGDYLRSDSSLTEKEAQARAQQADGTMAAGIGAAAVGAGLLVGGIIAW